MITAAAVALLAMAPPPPAGTTVGTGTGAPPATGAPTAPAAAPPGTPPAGTGAGAGAGAGTGAGFSTISGRPPEYPLKRTDPRIWEAKLEANLWAPVLRRGDTETIRLADIRVWMPFVLQSTWSEVDASSIKTDIWTQGARHAAPADRTTYRQGLAQGLAAVGISIPDVKGQSLKWNIRWLEQCWASQVDEAAAAAKTWPAEWPAEVQESLQPQPGIEAGHADFKAFVDRVSKGKLRQVTPWVAAKELVRATIQAYTAIDVDGIRLENGFPRGIVFNGAWQSMRNGTGTSHDVAAACVAALRTAGIPSRVVLGMTEVPVSSGVTKARFVTWIEFYLPDAGWVPVNPMDLKGSVRGGLSVERPWPSFGTWEELNEYLPVCYGFVAPVPGAISMPYPAAYAWSARGQIDLSQASDSVTLQILGRGRGKP